MTATEALYLTIQKFKIEKNLDKLNQEIIKAINKGKTRIKIEVEYHTENKLICEYFKKLGYGCNLTYVYDLNIEKNVFEIFWYFN